MVGTGLWTALYSKNFLKTPKCCCLCGLSLLIFIYQKLKQKEIKYLCTDVLNITVINLIHVKINKSFMKKYYIFPIIEKLYCYL